MSEKGRKKKNIIKECFILEKYDISIFFYRLYRTLFKICKTSSKFLFFIFFSNSIIWDGGGYETSRKTC